MATDNQLDNELELRANLEASFVIVNTTGISESDYLVYNSTTHVFEPKSLDTSGIYGTGSDPVAVVDGGTGATSAAAARTNLGLGSFSTQASDSVAITGGTIANVTMTDPTVGELTGAVTANSLTTASATITGGSISGLTTPIAVADGGTGATSLTGILKGNGTSAFSAATENTDYLTPGGTAQTVPNGGTGITTPTAYATIIGGTTTTAACQQIGPGTKGYALTSAGAGANPTFSDPGVITNDLKAVLTTVIDDDSFVDISTNGWNQTNSFIVIQGLTFTDAAGQLEMRLRNSSGVVNNSLYYLSDAETKAKDRWTLTKSVLSSTAGNNVTGYIYWLGNATTKTVDARIDSHLTYLDSSNNIVNASYHGQANPASANTHIRLSASKGNLSKGRITIYEMES